MNKRSYRDLAQHSKRVGEILVNSSGILTDDFAPDELKRKIVSSAKCATKVLYMILEGAPNEHIEAAMEAGKEEIDKLESLCVKNGWIKES